MYPMIEGQWPKKTPRRGSINLNGAALLLVHQRREHFELMRRNAFREKGDDILNARRSQFATSMKLPPRYFDGFRSSGPARPR